MMGEIVEPHYLSRKEVQLILVALENYTPGMSNGIARKDAIRLKYKLMGYGEDE